MAIHKVGRGSCHAQQCGRCPLYRFWHTIDRTQLIPKQQLSAASSSKANVHTVHVYIYLPVRYRPYLLPKRTQQWAFIYSRVVLGFFVVAIICFLRSGCYRTGHTSRTSGTSQVQNCAVPLVVRLDQLQTNSNASKVASVVLSGSNATPPPIEPISVEVTARKLKMDDREWQLS